MALRRAEIKVNYMHGKHEGASSCDELLAIPLSNLCIKYKKNKKKQTCGHPGPPRNKKNNHGLRMRSIKAQMCGNGAMGPEAAMEASWKDVEIITNLDIEDEYGPLKKTDKLFI